MNEQTSIAERLRLAMVLLITAIIALLFAFLAVWECSLYWHVFPVAVKIFVGVVAFIPSYCVTLGLCGLTLKVYNIATERRVYMPTEDGLYIQEHGRIRGYPSLRGNTPLKQLGTTKIEEITPEIPRLAVLLQDEALTTESAEVLLGYRSNGTPRYGKWPSVFAMLGIGNSGKSVSMVLFIIIALLTGYEVVVCDPHKTKERSIYNKLKVLEGYITFAFTTQEIERETMTFSRELKAKKTGEVDASHKKLLVIDELTSLVKRTPALSKQLVTVIEEASQEGMGYNHNIMIATHGITVDAIGDVAIRNALNGVFCHRVDSDQSKYVIKDKRYYKRTGSLPSGHVFYRDELHEIEYLIMPLSEANDMRVALKSLQDKGLIGQAGSVAGSLTYPDTPALTQGSYTRNGYAEAHAVNGQINDKQSEKTLVNVGLEPLQPNPYYVSKQRVESERETIVESVNASQINSDSETVALIKRLRKRGIAHRDISYAVGMYGTRYDEYRSLCTRNGIEIEDVKQSA